MRNQTPTTEADARTTGVGYAESSGNVFADLGFDPDEAANLYVRSVLLIQIEQHLNTLGLTQAEIGDRLGLTQNRVSYLLNGKTDKFSIDALVNLASKLGLRPSIHLEDPALSQEA